MLLIRTYQKASITTMELHFTIDIITVAERFHRMRRKDLILLKVVLGSSMVIDYIDHRHILS